MWYTWQKRKYVILLKLKRVLLIKAIEILRLLWLLFQSFDSILGLKRQYQTIGESSDGRNNHTGDTNTDISGHVSGGNDGSVPGSAFHIGPNEDMGQVRLGQQGNYHVTNTTNKEW